MKSIKIGFAPTRRSIFSAPDAVKYANLTRERLKELGVEFVDITDINEEGLFYDEADREKIQEKFRRENVKGIFFPHGNFGTEYVCARLAKEMGLPVLLWGPRDERPDENGVRLRDSQCGLFATGKVLRRFGVPFTYMTNCRLTDPEFERGIKDCNGVQREHNKKLNNGLPILHKVPPKRDYGRYFCIMAEKGGTSHGGLTEKLSPFFHAKKQEVNAYGR